MIPLRLLAGVTALGLSLSAGNACAVAFDVRNLVSDGAVPARTTDPALKNPWGLAHGPTSPFWAADNGTGLSTLYNGAGDKLGLTVTIPAAAGAPTGVVFNGTAASFKISGAKPAFIFDTEDGAIAGWAGAFGTTAQIAVLNAPGTANYKGLAIGTASGGDRLWAANFLTGAVDTYDPLYAPVFGPTFLDPTLPSGYAPFNVQVLGGDLYVAYALQDATASDEVAGAGFGAVDVYTLDGALIRRLVSPGGQVNAPWGLTIAPSSFRDLAGSLLVGNFGDGTISAFDPTNGGFRGKLLGRDGDPLVIDGLWALLPGNGAAGGDVNRIYFTAGPNDEANGLFGVLSVAPEPSSWLTMLLGFSLLGAGLRAHRRRAWS